MGDNGSNFVDEKLFTRVSKGVKLIQFGVEFEQRSNESKIKYLKKLASSLNHAAVTIQHERDVLNKLLFDKEAQLVDCKTQRSRDREMIQKQLLRENKTKQGQAEQLQALTMEKKTLREEIKRLKDGDIH